MPLEGQHRRCLTTSLPMDVMFEKPALVQIFWTELGLVFSVLIHVGDYGVVILHNCAFSKPGI